MKIINNFIENKKLKLLQENITDFYFPWYLQNGVNYENDGYFQFTHNFVKDEKTVSEFIIILEPILDILKAKKLIKVKLNLLNKTGKIIEHGFHIDTAPGVNCYTGILYLNTNNGYTKFKDNTIIISEENKFVEFNSTTEHTGSTYTDKDHRIVLNLNYFK
jgi:hypothetical protein